MAPWVLESDTESLGRTFARPLGVNELGFYYDACFEMTAVMVAAAVLETKDDETDALLAYENICKAWINVKRIYPVLGAKVRCEVGTDNVCLSVSEKLINEVNPSEIVYTSSHSAVESSRMLHDFTYRSQSSFHDTPARVLIIRHLWEPRRWHVATAVSHFISDALSSTHNMRVFIDLLAFPGMPDVADLETRLAMAVPTEDLSPTRRLRTSAQRWRFAIAGVIHTLRNSKIQVRMAVMIVIMLRTSDIIQ